MKAKIIQAAGGFTVTHPMNQRRLTFNNLLQVVTWCRENGFVASWDFGCGEITA